MRMAEDQLVIQTFNDVVDIKGSKLLFHLGMEHNLKQQVAKLLLHMIRIILIDRFKHLIGFLYEILAEGFMGLLAVPGAALRTAQNIHNFMQTGKAAPSCRLRTVRRNVYQ
ncbi:hypothetical protein D3C85_1539230 [compost metagenome]